MLEILSTEFSHTVLITACVFFLLIIDLVIKNKRIANIILIINFVVYSTIRYNVGTDYLSYLNIHNNIKNWYDSILHILQVNTQPGLSILSFVIAAITNKFYYFFFAVALMIYPFMVNYMRDNSFSFRISLMLYILLGFFNVSLNILKQSVAMVFFIKSFECLSDDRKFRSLLWIAIAGQFHLTAFIAYGIALLSRYFKPSYKLLMTSILVGIILLIFYKPLLIMLFKHTNVFNTYSHYILEDSIKMNRNYRWIANLGYSFLFSAISYFLLISQEFSKYNRKYSMMLSSIILSIPISIISLDLWVLNRVALYSYQFSIILIPLFFNRKYKSKQEYFATFFVLLSLAVIWFYFFSVVGGNNQSREYKTIFNALTINR